MTQDQTETKPENTVVENIDNENVEFQRMRNDMHKFKRKFLEVEKEKLEYAEKVKELENRALQNSENYKELWEKERQRAESLEGEYKGLKNSIVENRKRDAIVKEAVKAGINKELLDVLDAFDMSDVLVEQTDNGKFVVNGADTWVSALKNEKPSMFGPVKNDVKFNNKSGNFDNREKTYTHAEVLELQKNDYDKYQDIITNKRHLIV